MKLDRIIRPLVCCLLLAFLGTPLFAQTTGCTDYEATNYDPNATSSNGSCTYPATTYPLTFKAALPTTLAETSGLVYVNGNLWSHEDSGGDPAIYRVDTATGTILQTVTLTGATNVDWEDITTDGTHLYIGDVGNNANGNRTNLKVYKVKLSDISPGVTSVSPEVINFSYSDQIVFTATGNNNTNFDCEALIYYQNALHLFSKNWLNYKTRHYVLSATAGTHVAQYKEEYNINGLISGASINANNEIVLLGYNLLGNAFTYTTFLYKLAGFQSELFFSGKVRRIELGYVYMNGQVEGITYKNNGSGFVSCETRSIITQKLYTFALPTLTGLPGSGNAVNLDGTNDYVSATGPDVDQGDFTVEAWVQPATGLAGGILSQGGNNATGYFLEANASGTLTFGTRVGNADNGTLASPAAALTSGKWQHVAVSVKRGASGNLTKMYVNGWQVAEGNIASGDLTQTTLQMGKVDNSYLNGQVDEVRIWNKALAETTLREWLCRKVYSQHAEYASLKAYYRFDEATGTTTSERISGNQGTLQNGASRVRSGASLGDMSTTSYASPTSLSLSHPEGDYLAVQVTSGFANAIHVYRVNEVAAASSLPSGIQSLDSTRYWGVFVAGGTNPVYTATYHYQSNSTVQNESIIGLVYRANNAAATWIDPAHAPDMQNHTLSITGMTGTEYSLAALGTGALPVSLLDFSARWLDDSQVLLQWTTEKEVNNDQFEVERAADARHFTSIGTVKGAGNSHLLRNYQLVDAQPLPGTAYYRLKQRDYDGRITYSKTKAVLAANGNDGIVISPNPFTDYIDLHVFTLPEEPLSLILTDVLGRNVSEQGVVIANQTQRITLGSHLPSGIYYLSIQSRGMLVRKKLVKQ